VAEKEMNVQASHNNDHLLPWMAAILLLMGFGLGDTGIIAWCTSLITLGQLVVITSSFALIGMGMLFTIWQMRRQ
jgi:hypothetical protein